MRTGVRVGIDVGTVRIGVARSDFHGMLATPVETVPRQRPGGQPAANTPPADLARISAIVAELDAVEVIVGLPLALSGRHTASTEDAVSFAQYFLPGMIATGMMLTSFQALATSLAVERDDGSLKRLRTTPLPPVAFFLGKIGQVLVVSLAQTTLLVAAGALLFGIEVPGSLDAWVTFAWVFVLGTAVGTVCGIAFSSVPRSGRSVTAVVLPVVLVLQFTSGVFFVFSDLPTWMQRFAEVFPLKWLAQGMRSVFLPDSAQAAEVSGSWQHGPTAVILVAWLILGLVVCVRTFRWRRRDDG